MKKIEKLMLIGVEDIAFPDKDKNGEETGKIVEKTKFTFVNAKQKFREIGIDRDHKEIANLKKNLFEGYKQDEEGMPIFDATHSIEISFTGKVYKGDLGWKFDTLKA